MPDSQHLTWVDIETFGLDPEADPILEIGVMITDLNLEPLWTWSQKIWSPLHEARLHLLKASAKDGNKGAQIVWDMHTKNGLFTVAGSHGIYLEDAIEDLLERFPKEHKGQPMCGSSVHFDRAHLRVQAPEVDNLFHYRNIDTSTIKELCRRFNPEVYGKLPEKKEQHRVIPDLHDTLSEARFYLDNFMFVTIPAFGDSGEAGDEDDPCPNRGCALSAGHDGECLPPF